MNFRHKVCLVIGGTRGLGCVIARHLYEQNAVLIIAGRSQSRGQSFVHELGENAFFFPCDITIPAQIGMLFDRIESTFGMLHCAVNSTGITVPYASVRDIDITLWRNVLETELAGPLHCLKREVRLISRLRGGAVVNVGSCAGVQAIAGRATYYISKAAIDFLTRATAIKSAEAEAGRYAVRVNAVAPGPIGTGMHFHEKLVADHRNRQSRIRVADMKYTVDPSEIAEAVSFLLSDRAGYMTGTVLSIDSGYNGGRFLQT